VYKSYRNAHHSFEPVHLKEAFEEGQQFVVHRCKAEELVHRRFRFDFDPNDETGCEREKLSLKAAVDVPEFSREIRMEGNTLFYFCAVTRRPRKISMHDLTGRRTSSAVRGVSAANMAITSET